MRLDGLEAADRIACRGSADRLYGTHMTKTSHLCTIAIVVLCMARTALAADRPAWPASLPVYDHIVLVIEENKNFEQIVGGRFEAAYLRRLAPEGASFERIVA